MKIFLIIIDGLGDKPIPELGNKTPLEAANTPNLDFLAKNGICGAVNPFAVGDHPTSEDTHFALLGYNPKASNPGRGVLEVLGIGKPLKILPGDVCLRGNFATVDSNLKIIDRRAGRIEETKDLIKAIDKINIEGVEFLIGKAVSHRIGIIMRGKNLSSKISDSSPKRIGIIPLDKTQKAKFTARVLNEFLSKTHQILKNHAFNKKRKDRGLLPANYILVRGAGMLKKVPSFQEKWGLKACCIAGGALYKGIGKFLEMEAIQVKGANALPTTNLKGKFRAARNALKKHDFIFLHIKAADNLAEDGDFSEKKEFIERVDKSIKPLIKLKNTLIIVTADHSTCSKLRRHCLEPIPLLIFGREKNGVEKFSEKSCPRGKLGKIKQTDLMKKILLYRNL